MVRSGRLSYLLFSIAVVLMPVLASGCASAPDYWKEARPGQKRVLASTPPLFALTHAVAGDRAYVLSMLTTEGPHQYHGGPTDLVKVNGADLFIYNGLTLDDAFVTKMTRSHRNSKLRMLNVGAVLDRSDKDLPDDRKLIRGKPVKHGDHFHGAEDPHYWLGPSVAMAVTEIIAEKLIEVDPEGAEGYKLRSREMVKKLTELKEYGQKALKDKTSKKIITMHDAFKYFARDFAIEIVGNVQDLPGDDIDAVKMKELVELCKSKGIRVIAVEPQYSRATPEALQRSLRRDGIEIQIIELDPLETTPAETGKQNPDPGHYFQKMRENIDALARALP